MGKNSVKSKRYIQKIEVAAIALLAFLIYFSLNDDASEGLSFTAAPEKAPFLDPGAEPLERGAGFLVFFDDEIEKAASRLAAEAETSIKIATYTYAKSGFTQLLERRAKENLKVRVVAGRNRDNSSPIFDFFVVPMKSGIYHPKFMVFDSKDVLISSANISSDPNARNNAVLFFDVPEAAAILEAEIDDQFDGRNERRCGDGCESEIGTIYFNPGHGCAAVRDLLLGVTERIYGGIYTMTLKNPMVTGLKKAAKRNVDISIVVDNWRGREGNAVNSKAFDFLRSIGVNIFFDEPGGADEQVFHHKSAVIDGRTTVLGSMNWTASGCYKNRELIVINRDAGIAEGFEKYFKNFAVR